MHRFVNKDADDLSSSVRGDTSRRFGNSPPCDSYVRRPGLALFNFGLIKSTPVHPPGEQARLEFRAEFFNLCNTPVFSNPIPDSFNAKFGAITCTKLPNRKIQFGLKLYF